MNFIYRLLLTFNATSLILVVFLVKEQYIINYIHCHLSGLPNYVSYMIFFLVPLVLTFLSLIIARCLSG